MKKYLQRFEMKFSVDLESKCWIWHGSGSKIKGYGRFSYDKKVIQASHAALLIYKNVAVPGGMDACHSCDNPFCVNPDHLFIGTRKDNMADCKRKIRERNHLKGHHGSENGRSKLTEAQVIGILRLLRVGMSHKELSLRYKVSVTAIWMIDKSITWKHVNRSF